MPSTVHKKRCTHLHEVHDHVELLRGLEGVVQAHDERVPHVGKDRALRLRPLHLWDKIQRV
jgi:hypothetical protein